jgi:hypothetical protein
VVLQTPYFTVIPVLVKLPPAAVTPSSPSRQVTLALPEVTPGAGSPKQPSSPSRQAVSTWSALARAQQGQPREPGPGQPGGAGGSQGSHSSDVLCYAVELSGAGQLSGAQLGCSLGEAL